MKVVLLVSELEDYTIAYANGLARHCDVVLCVPRRRYEALSEWVDPRVDLRLLDWPRHRSASNPVFIWRLVRLIRRERPDIVHLLSNTTLWLNVAVPFLRPARIVTTVHDVQVHPGDRDTAVLPRWATDLIVRQSHHVVVHGEALRQAAEVSFGVAPGALHVLPHPAIPRYSALAAMRGIARKPGSNGFNVLFFGRIYAYKGLEYLLKAEAELKDRLPDLNVVIAGRGDDPKTLQHLMGDPARYDIRFGFIPDEEVAQLFVDADLVVLPYTEASQSGVLNVAAPFGLPVIVTDVGELGTTVGAAGMGLVVPPRDSAALAGAIVELAADPARRAVMGANAQAWAGGRNSPAAVGSAAASLYASVIAGAGAAPTGPHPTLEDASHAE